MANSGKSLKHVISLGVFMIFDPDCVPRCIVQSSPLKFAIALRQTLQGETRGSETEMEHGRDDVSFQTTLVLLRLSPYAFMHLFAVHWHFVSVHLGLYHLTRSKLRSCTLITFYASPSHILQSVGRHVFISAYHRKGLLYAPRPAGPSRS